MKKNKIITLEDSDLTKLNIQAAHKGKKLKPYIEEQLTRLAQKPIVISQK